jgi:hypothetical protein
MAQIYKKSNGEWAYRVYYRDALGKRHSINASHLKKNQMHKMKLEKSK